MIGDLTKFLFFIILVVGAFGLSVNTLYYGYSPYRARECMECRSQGGQGSADCINECDKSLAK